MNIKTKLNMITKNDYLFTLVNKVTTIVLGVVTSACINRYAGPSLRGQYTVILNYINIFSVVANLGIYQGYPYYKRKQEKNVLEKFTNLFYLQFILYFSCFIIALFITKKILILSILFMISFSVLTNQLNFLMMVEYIQYRNKANIILAICKLLLSVGLLIIGYKNIMFLLINLFLYDLILLIFYLLKLKVKVDVRCLEKKFVLSVIKFGIIPMITSLLINLNYKLDVLMLDKYVDISYIGYYSVGVALAELAWIIPDTFKEVLFGKTSNSDSVEQIVKCLKVSFYAILVVIIGVVIFGRSFIVIMYGKEFIKSYGVTVLLFLGVPAMSWFKIISTLYLAKGKQFFYLMSLLISVLLNFIINLIVIPKFSIYGSAFASIISYTICGGVFLLDFKNRYDIKISEMFWIKRTEVNKIVAFTKKRVS